MANVLTVSWLETTPAGTDDASAGDDRIREFKKQVRQIIDVEHDFPSSGNAADLGQHKQITFQEQADLGTGAVSATLLGSQTLDGKGELTYTDEDDATIIFTDDGNHYPITISPTGATAAALDALTIDQNNNKTSIEIDSEAISDFVINVEGVNTSGIMVYLHNQGNQETGDLLKIVQDHESSAAEVVDIANDGTGSSLVINQVGVSGSNQHALWVYSNAVQVNSSLVFLEMDNTSATQDLLELQNDGTGNGIYINQVGVNAANKSALWVYSNAVQNAASLVFLEQDNSSSGQDVLKIQNDGTGKGVYVAQVGNGIGMNIVKTAGHTQVALLVQNDAASQYCATFENDGNNVNRYGIGIRCGADDGSGDNYMIGFFDGDGTGHGYITLDDGTLEIEQVSDMSLKENIKDTESVLDKVNQLKVRDFNYKKLKDKKQTSFVAQEVAEVFPDIGGCKDDIHTIKPLKLIPILVKAVQELNARIDAL